MPQCVGYTGFGTWLASTGYGYSPKFGASSAPSVGKPLASVPVTTEGAVPGPTGLVKSQPSSGLALVGSALAGEAGRAGSGPNVLSVKAGAEPDTPQRCVSTRAPAGRSTMTSWITGPTKAAVDVAETGADAVPTNGAAYTACTVTL